MYKVTYLTVLVLLGSLIRAEASCPRPPFDCMDFSSSAKYCAFIAAAENRVYAFRVETGKRTEPL